jgi:hypothetical protein
MRDESPPEAAGMTWRFFEKDINVTEVRTERLLTLITVQATNRSAYAAYIMHTLNEVYAQLPVVLGQHLPDDNLGL